MNEFLVKCTENKKNIWIDVDNGQQFEKCNVPYKQCKHGLCAILKRKVLKKNVDDGSEHLVFMSVEKMNPQLPKKGISFQYKNEDGLNATWNFTPYEITIAIKCLNEDRNDRELAVKLFAPRDVVKKLRYKLTGGLIEKIEKELGGDINGKRKRTKFRITTSNRTSYVKTAVKIPGSK